MCTHTQKKNHQRLPATTSPRESSERGGKEEKERREKEERKRGEKERRDERENSSVNTLTSELELSILKI